MANAEAGRADCTVVLYGIAVENGKNVICLMVNGSKLTVDTNIIGFAALAKAGVPVISVQR